MRDPVRDLSDPAKAVAATAPRAPRSITATSWTPYSGNCANVRVLRYSSTNKPAAPNAGIAPQLAIGSHWPGVVSRNVDMALKMSSGQSDFFPFFHGLSSDFAEWPAQWAGAASTTVDHADMRESTQLRGAVVITRPRFESRRVLSLGTRVS